MLGEFNFDPKQIFNKTLTFDTSLIEEAMIHIMIYTG